jgi:muramoyltetrapeptide carboxypeptidase
VRKIKPDRLKYGDLVGIVAPSGVFDESLFHKGISNIEKLGFRVTYEDEIFYKERYLAGNDRVRAEQLHKFFSNKEIKTIFCVRGGYGAIRILPRIDFDIIKNNPKIFMGYSDITILINNIFQKTGLITFHGPMVCPDFSEGLTNFTEKFLFELLIEGKFEIDIENTDMLKEGKASGILTGGSLSVILSSLKTPYEIRTVDKILFLEDINEPLYKIDRMITQLKLASKLNGVKGIILGDFGTNDSLRDLFLELFSDFNMPIIYKFPSGHISNNITIPIGIKVMLDTYKQKLYTMEGILNG